MSHVQQAMHLGGFFLEYSGSTEVLIITARELVGALKPSLAIFFLETTEHIHATIWTI